MAVPEKTKGSRRDTTADGSKIELHDPFTTRRGKDNTIHGARTKWGDFDAPPPPIDKDTTQQ